MSLGYYHTTYGNFYVLDNTLVAPTDYSPYCVTAPTDSRLGSVSGQQLCGLYDLNPNKFGQNRSIVTNVSNYGKQTEVYDGVDLSVNARLQKLTVTGGWNIGTAVQTGTTAGGTAGSRQNNCFVVDSPQQLFNCDIKVPFQNRVKFARVVPSALRRAARGRLPDQPGRDLQRERHLHERAGSAEPRPSAGRRRRDRDRQRRAAVLAIRRSRESVRPARRQDLPDSAASGSRPTSTSTMCSISTPW